MAGGRPRWPKRPDEFGAAVALDGDLALNLFARVGDDYTGGVKITESDGQDVQYFGSPVAISGWAGRAILPDRTP